MKPDIVEFVESILGLELTDFQKKFLRTCYEHKDEMTEPLYLNINRSNKKVLIEALKTCMEVYGMAIDERYFYGQHGIDIEKAYSERILGHCKDCKYFEYDSVAKVDGVPLIVVHEICSKWGNGCKTKEDGYCFLFEPKEEEEDDYGSIEISEDQAEKLSGNVGYVLSKEEIYSLLIKAMEEEEDE